MRLENKPNQYGFIILLGLLIYLFFIIAKVYFTYAMLGAILALAFYPLYQYILRLVGREKLAAAFTMIIVIIIIVIPALLATIYLTTESYSMVSSIDRTTLQQAQSYIKTNFNYDLNITQTVPEVFGQVQGYLLSTGVRIAESVADIIIGLLIMFSIIYYGLCEGKLWMVKVRKILPMEPEKRQRLVSDIRIVTRSVLYGQIVFSVVMGLAEGLIFWIAGVKNPLFWGILMAIFAILPLVGTGIVWVPAGIILIMTGHPIAGIFILVASIILNGVQHFITPMIVAGQSRIHPLVILIGIFGGIKVFGFAGFLIGPMIAALFFTIIEFYYADYISS